MCGLDRVLMVRLPDARAIDFSQSETIPPVRQFAHDEGATMKTFHSGLTAEYDERLELLEQALCAVLRAREEQTMSASPDETPDFKDLATRASEQSMDAVQAEHAAIELEDVLAARRRLKELSYGLCLDCGTPIDLRRLSVMPATRYCTSCQSRHEDPDGPALH